MEQTWVPVRPQAPNWDQPAAPGAPRQSLLPPARLVGGSPRTLGPGPSLPQLQPTGRPTQALPAWPQLLPLPTGLGSSTVDAGSSGVGPRRALPLPGLTTAEHLSRFRPGTCSRSSQSNRSGWWQCARPAQKAQDEEDRVTAGTDTEVQERGCTGCSNRGHSDPLCCPHCAIALCAVHLLQRCPAGWGGSGPPPWREGPGRCTPQRLR